MKETNNSSKKQKQFYLHPNDKVLADFIDGKLSTKEQRELIEHLVYCDECVDIVTIIIKKKH